MTNREGNTDAPKVGTHEVQAEDRSGSAPRRVEDVRKDREAERHRREEELGTSWVSVVLGWLAALGAGLILSGIVGTIFGTAGSQGIVEGGTTALIGLLATLLLAFLIGGYVAGRLASRQGLKHGILVPLLALVVTIVLAIAGGLVGVSFICQLSGVTLPQGAQQSAQQATPRQGLGTILTVSGILALLFPFIGGAIGGLWGARTGRRRP